MLLRCMDSPRFAIPGGKLEEDEFLRAAKLSGSDKVQLQIAAREGAARQLYEATGIDVRGHLERLKPAVLQINPVADATGHKLLKNEHENSLFYFLQVAEEDFQPTQAMADQDGSSLVPPLDEADSPMKVSQFH
jgi:8-oxo-dGTP pyrophosphatase MutT (NUDIX family)